MSLTNILLPLLLLAIPFTTVADEYAAVREKLKLCTTCHGPKGAKPQFPQYPILAGQEFYYLYVQLKDFKSGLREDPIMKPIASTLEKQEMLTLAKYFSEQTWPNIGHRASDEDIEVGKKVVHAGECVACHLGSFKGNSRVPRLAGQNPEYMKKTMLDFKYKKRKNSPAKGSLLATFPEEEIKSVAEYLSDL